MQFEWDDDKARLNRFKHKVDFDAVHDFDLHTALYQIDDAINYGEERWKAIGLIGLQLYVLIFTERADRIRVISLRKAYPWEEKEFYER